MTHFGLSFCSENTLACEGSEVASLAGEFHVIRVLSKYLSRIKNDPILGGVFLRSRLLNYVAIHENDRISLHCEMKIRNGIRIINESSNSFIKSIYNINRFE